MGDTADHLLERGGSADQHPRGREPAGDPGPARQRGASDEAALLRTPSCPAAFGPFYRRHVRGVLHYHYRRTRDAEIAADLTAETFAAALHSVAGFDPDRGTPTQWLYGIASNQVSQFWRRRRVSDKLRHKLSIHTIEIDPAQAAELERVEALAGVGPVLAAVERLPHRLRAAVELRVLGGLGYDEIADRLGCTNGAARVRVLRGLRRLNDLLDGHG
jgi:RNA polymerase sigma factor (sigma-70 family)